MVAIPQDIIDNVIEAVGDDRRLLKECALVSSSFLLPCRKRLFSKLCLSRDQTCQRLHQFLVENPVVQSFVRSITIDLDELLNCTSLIAILRLPFCCLESFCITKNKLNNGWRKAPLIWSDFSGELKDTLSTDSTVIHSSTLKTLYLREVALPISMLFLGNVGINLSKLELTDGLSNEFDGEQSRLLTSGASEGVATTAPHRVVDHCIWRCFDSVHGRTEPIFLPFMCRLRVLEIYRDTDPCSATMRDFFDNLSLLIRSLRVSLTSPATLEHLKFDIEFTSDDFDLDDVFNDLRDADVWSHLDSIITHPTGSRLQRVDINIVYRDNSWDEYTIMEPRNTEFSEPVFDALPLLRKKGILFVEVTGTEF